MTRWAGDGKAEGKRSIVIWPLDPADLDPLVLRREDRERREAQLLPLGRPLVEHSDAARALARLSQEPDDRRDRGRVHVLERLEIEHQARAGRDAFVQRVGEDGPDERHWIAGRAPAGP